MDVDNVTNSQKLQHINKYVLVLVLGSSRVHTSARDVDRGSRTTDVVRGDAGGVLEEAHSAPHRERGPDAGERVGLRELQQNYHRRQVDALHHRREFQVRRGEEQAVHLAHHCVDEDGGGKVGREGSHLGHDQRVGGEEPGHEARDAERGGREEAARHRGRAEEQPPRLPRELNLRGGGGAAAHGPRGRR
eukprot:880387-Prorocentrum_minimum.AAC.1